MKRFMTIAVVLCGMALTGARSAQADPFRRSNFGISISYGNGYNNFGGGYSRGYGNVYGGHPYGGYGGYPSYNAYPVYSVPVYGGYHGGYGGYGGGFGGYRGGFGGHHHHCR